MVPIKNLKLTIKFKSPVGEQLRDEECTVPVVDHIDLIAGEITGKVDPIQTPDYTNATNETTKVIATFSRRDCEKDQEGFSTIVYHIKDVDKNMYFRLRGTNLAPEHAR